MNEKYLTSVQACDFLGVSRNTFDAIAKKEGLTRYRKSGRYLLLYDIDELKVVKAKRPERQPYVLLPTQQIAS